MTSSKERKMKGIVHVALALLAVAEVFTACTKTRKLLLGSAAGWHSHAAIYHFFYET